MIEENAMNIFISYAREDAISANRLYEDLLGIRDVTPWLDSKRLLPGARWKQEIMQALDTCELCIVLLSKNSVSKAGFIQKEIVEALEKLKTFPPDRIYIIPARLDDCHPQHLELNDLQWVDMFPDWETGFSLISKTVLSLQVKTTASPSMLNDIIIETISSADHFANRLQVRGEMIGCDAMELMLQGQDFQNLDFSGGNFVRCSFVECDFRNANLTGVNFEGARFHKCKFSGANLWGVNFWGADLRSASGLEKAVIKQTNFFRTKLNYNQEKYIIDNEEAMILSDYDSFLNHFSVNLKMDDETIGRTFIWVNSRYFRMMYSS
jgi:uncharacterized protein YjbI with pentapeptide repeats